MNKKILFLGLIAALTIGMFSWNSCKRKSPLQEAKHLGGDEVTLSSFRARPLGRDTKKESKKILDSHLESDNLPGVVRKGLQQFFGDAGKGIIFPKELSAFNAAADKDSNGVLYQTITIMSSICIRRHDG